MKGVIAYIRLTRPVNLLIIALTMYAMRWCIIYPVLQVSKSLNLQLKMPEWKFALSVLVMVLLAAAGNVINDYFDVKVDRINKPDRVLVGRTVKRRVAMVSHQVITGLACVIGLYLAWDAGVIVFGAIPLFIAGSLWYYSVTFKRQLLIGNFVVALMVGIVPLWAGVFELNGLMKVYGDLVSNIDDFIIGIWYWLLGYSLFAFLTTLIREAQKDIQDLVGDRAGNFNTLPIAYGSTIAKAYTLTLNSILIVMMGFVGWTVVPFGSGNLSFTALFILLVIIPAGLSWWTTFRAQNADQYGRASLMMKLTMLGGILFAPVLALLISEMGQ